QVGQVVVVARLAEHNSLAPERMASSIEFLQHDVVEIVARGYGPSDNDRTLTGTSYFGGVMSAGTLGELHASLSPHRLPRLAHHGRSDLLVGTFTRVQERQ